MKGKLIRLPCSLKFTAVVNLSQYKPPFTLPFPVSGTIAMQLCIHCHFTDDLLRKWSLRIFSSCLKDFDSLPHSNPWFVFQFGVAQYGSACFAYKSNQKSFQRAFLVYWRCFLCRCLPQWCVVLPSPSEQKKNRFKLQSMKSDLESYSDLHRGMHYICQCSTVPIENICCGFFFSCWCISGVYLWSIAGERYIHSLYFILTCDWLVQKNSTGVNILCKLLLTCLWLSPFLVVTPGDTIITLSCFCVSCQPIQTVTL